MNPKLSLVMPVYNQEEFVKKAIESILRQSFKNFEFLILDDASQDQSLKIIKSFKDKRIRIFVNKKRQGLAKNLNFLISKARGKYIARMDGDDLSEKRRLEKQVDFFNRHPQVVLIGSWAKIIDQKSKIIGKVRQPIGYQQIRKKILSDNPFVHPSVVFKKDVFIKEGGYDEKLFYSQDYDLFLKLVVKYKCVNLPQFLIKFRWQPDFKKQKKQHRIALKIRLRAIKQYGYQKWEIVKLVRPLLLYFIPTGLKRLYWQKRFK